MKRNPLLLLVLAVFLALLSPRPAGASVSFDFFYENLSPHGEWVEADGYGTCWRPSGIDADWAPYTDGYWVYTDAGWTWVSYEDFGSITYHYGRWVRIDGYGWIWKPDYEWAPAWVSWRYSDDYVGWAPLPPEARWDSGVGISIWADRDYDIGPGYYSFCETRHFGAPVLRNVLLGRSLNISIITKTKNVTNITYRKDKTVYSGGPDYRRISGKSHRRIETLKLERRTQWNRKEKLPRNHRVGNGLVVEAPYIERSRPSSKSPRVSRRIEKPKIDKGWNNIADVSARNRAREKMHEETKGLSRKNAPARPVDERAFEEATREAKRDQRRKEDPSTQKRNYGAPQPKEEKEKQRDEFRRSENQADRDRREGEQRQRDEQRRAEQSARQRQQAERESRERDQQRQRNEERDRQRDEQRKAEKNQYREQADRARREGEQRQRNEQRKAERNSQRQQQEQAARARRESDRSRGNDWSRNDDRKRENDRSREKSEKKQNRSSSESSEKKGKKKKD